MKQSYSIRRLRASAVFHCGLETYLFHKSFPSYTPGINDFFVVFLFSFYFYLQFSLATYGRLSWLLSAVNSHIATEEDQDYGVAQPTVSELCRMASIATNYCIISQISLFITSDKLNPVTMSLVTFYFYFYFYYMR